MSRLVAVFLQKQVFRTHQSQFVGRGADAARETVFFPLRG
jgi:hypothetical protein